MAKSRVRTKPRKPRKAPGQAGRIALSVSPDPHETSEPHALLPDFVGLEWVAGNDQPQRTVPSQPRTSTGRTGPAAGPVSGARATLLREPVAQSPTQVEAATPARVTTASPHRALEVMSFGCNTLNGADPQGLGLTYWFDAAAEGEPYPVTVRFIGQHSESSQDQPSGNHTFDVQTTVQHVIAGSGRIAVTARVLDLAPGEWRVTATPVSSPPRQNSGPVAVPTQQLALPHGSATGTTTFAPIARVRAPGVRLGAWPAFVGVGPLGPPHTQAPLAGHHPLEHVIVIDDGSDDATAQIVRGMATSEPSGRLIRHERHRGQGAAARPGSAGTTGALVPSPDGVRDCPPARGKRVGVVTVETPVAAAH